MDNKQRDKLENLVTKVVTYMQRMDVAMRDLDVALDDAYGKEGDYLGRASEVDAYWRGSGDVEQALAQIQGYIERDGRMYLG